MSKGREFHCLGAISKRLGRAVRPVQEPLELVTQSKANDASDHEQFERGSRSDLFHNACFSLLAMLWSLMVKV